MMTDDFELTEIGPEASATVPTAAQMATGIPIPPVRLLEVMSPEDWEKFTEEWLSFHRQNGTYQKVSRFSGPGDRGLDLVAFTSEKGFSELWDSYQCKHYDHALAPKEVGAEVAKIIYHSFNQTPPFNKDYRVPRRHVFVSPKGVGITVCRWLKDPETFKSEIRKRWDTECAPKIGMGISAPLNSNFLAYFDNFDFTIFDSRTGVELIEEHSKTIFYTSRFGHGFPPRGAIPTPPSEPTDIESVYLRKLLDAYGERLARSVSGIDDLASDDELREHYKRQRIRFYHAEALRNFARDCTPPETFESLQDDIYYGVIEVCNAHRGPGLDRVDATMTAAGQVDVSGNALVDVTRVPDKQGICHQLANDDRLTWVKADA